jgi:hypothetical protein
MSAIAIANASAIPRICASIMPIIMMSAIMIVCRVVVVSLFIVFQHTRCKNISMHESVFVIVHESESILE